MGCGLKKFRKGDYGYLFNFNSEYCTYIVIIILGYSLQVRGWFQESFGNDLSKLIMNVPCQWQFLPLFLNI